MNTGIHLGVQSETSRMLEHERHWHRFPSCRLSTPTRFSGRRESPEPLWSSGGERSCSHRATPASTSCTFKKGASSSRCATRPAEKPSWRRSARPTSSGRAAWRVNRSGWGARPRLRRAPILLVDKHKMLRLLHRQHAMSDRFIAHMLARNRRIQEDLLDQLFNSIEKRLARTLLLAACYGQHSKPQRVVPKISQDELANMLGTTRARVNFFLIKFKKLGFIEENGQFTINRSLLTVVLQD